MMAQEGGKQQNTAYGVFVQACWQQHKRQYPDELIHKEIEEFNKQCSVWWYNMSERERETFQEMADRSNASGMAGKTTRTDVGPSFKLTSDGRSNPSVRKRKEGHTDQ